MPRQKNPNYQPPTWVTFVIPSEDTDLLEWHDKYKAEGKNMSALIRSTLRKGIATEGPPQWFLDWLKDNNGVQPSIGEQKVDFEGLWPE